MDSFCMIPRHSVFLPCPVHDIHSRLSTTCPYIPSLTNWWPCFSSGLFLPPIALSTKHNLEYVVGNTLCLFVCLFTVHCSLSPVACSMAMAMAKVHLSIVYIFSSMSSSSRFCCSFFLHIPHVACNSTQKL